MKKLKKSALVAFLVISVITLTACSGEKESNEGLPTDLGEVEDIG